MCRQLFCPLFGHDSGLRMLSLWRPDMTWQYMSSSWRDVATRDVSTMRMRLIEGHLGLQLVPFPLPHLSYVDDFFSSAAPHLGHKRGVYPVAWQLGYRRYTGSLLVSIPPVLCAYSNGLSIQWLLSILIWFYIIQMDQVFCWMDIHDYHPADLPLFFLVFPCYSPKLLSLVSHFWTWSSGPCISWRANNSDLLWFPSQLRECFHQEFYKM